MTFFAITCCTKHTYMCLFASLYMQQYMHTHNWNGQGMRSCTVIYKYYPTKDIHLGY